MGSAITGSFDSWQLPGAVEEAPVASHGTTPALHNHRPHARIDVDQPAADPTPPSYLIITDHDRGAFSVEGQMTDDRRDRCHDGQTDIIVRGEPPKPATSLRMSGNARRGHAVIEHRAA
jgi:hypothetical protein